MEDVASIWSYQQSIDDLKHRLLYTTFELESARMDAKEEMKKSKDYVRQLLQLLEVACRERDEAKDQLQRLYNMVMPSSPTEISSVLPKVQQESPPLKPTRANSSITESDSLSESYNHHSYGSSPVDSFIDAVSSPELVNMNIGNPNIMGVPHQPFIQGCNVPIPVGIISSENGSASMSSISSEISKVDQALPLIDNLVKGKPLPQKGRLLQAVMEAGPLLQTLLIAGPLPQWRNPPPLQPFQVPAVSIKSCDPETISQKSVGIPNHMVQDSLKNYHDVSCQIYSTSMLNFSSSSSSCLNNGPLLSTGINRDVFHNQIQIGKRQRFQ